MVNWFFWEFKKVNCYEYCRYKELIFLVIEDFDNLVSFLGEFKYEVGNRGFILNCLTGFSFLIYKIMR